MAKLPERYDIYFLCQNETILSCILQAWIYTNHNPDTLYKTGHPGPAARADPLRGQTENNWMYVDLFPTLENEKGLLPIGCLKKHFKCHKGLPNPQASKHWECITKWTYEHGPYACVPFCLACFWRKCYNRITKDIVFQTFQGIAKLYQPIGRAMEPEEVAKNILFLASDDARMITGIQHVVDGGWLLAGSQPSNEFDHKLK